MGLVCWLTGNLSWCWALFLLCHSWWAPATPLSWVTWQFCPARFLAYGWETRKREGSYGPHCHQSHGSENVRAMGCIVLIWALPLRCGKCQGGCGTQWCGWRGGLVSMCWGPLCGHGWWLLLLLVSLPLLLLSWPCYPPNVTHPNNHEPHRRECSQAKRGHCQWTSGPDNDDNKLREADRT